MREHSNLALHQHEPLEDRSLKDLISSVGKDMSLLVRQEVQLAKAEISDKVENVAKGSAQIGIGAFLAYAGVLCAVATLVLVAIAIGIAPWVSALIVTVLLLIAGYSAIQSGRNSMKRGPAPLQRTKRSAEATVHEIKEQLT